MSIVRRFVKLGSLGAACALVAAAQHEHAPQFRVNVDLVTVTFTVTDAKGHYVHGLKPSDLLIREDGVIQKIVGFAEGTGPAVQFDGVSADALADAKVFVLFDTSNWMYAGFAYASDTVAEFVRRLDPADSVAIYKFSRNLFRAASLTADRSLALSAVRNSVAGDDTALFNCLLLTLRDASKIPGRKAVVVFSNGPDNASMVNPGDVGTVAENEGVPIYIVSTSDGKKDPASAHALERIAARTGGQTFWAQSWKQQAQAFASIRESLASSYTAAYYPSPNSNEGFRRIGVEVISAGGKQYHVRSRIGYHAPSPSQ